MTGYVRSRELEQAMLLSEVAREKRDEVLTEEFTLDLTDKELLRLCIAAHARDMTLNEYMVVLLEAVIEAELPNPELTLGDDEEPPVPAG